MLHGTRSPKCYFSHFLWAKQLYWIRLLSDEDFNLCLTCHIHAQSSPICVVNRILSLFGYHSIPFVKDKNAFKFGDSVLARPFYGFQSRGNEGWHDFYPGFLRIRDLHNCATQDSLSTRPTPITTSDTSGHVSLIWQEWGVQRLSFCKTWGEGDEKKGGNQPRTRSINQNKQITYQMFRILLGKTLTKYLFFRTNFPWRAGVA